MPILGLEPTQFISEGYCLHALNFLGFRKKYADIGTRTNAVYFRRLLPTRVKLFGCRKKYADIGNRTNTVYFRSLLATRVQLPGLQKEICRYWDSNQYSLFPKDTGKTRSTIWAAERNVLILGLKPTQFISEDYCQNAFNYLGFRKKYADIGTRTNPVYFRRLLATRVLLPGLQKEICRYWDSNQHRLFPKARLKLPGLQKEISRCWDSNKHSFFLKATASTP